jgi:hypothetical protein
MERTPPLAIRLPRQPGRKEQRYAQLFAGEPVQAAEEHMPAPESARLKVMAENERIGMLEEEVGNLRAEVEELRRVVAEFRAQFE